MFMVYKKTIKISYVIPIRSTWKNHNTFRFIFHRITKKVHLNVILWTLISFHVHLLFIFSVKLQLGIMQYTEINDVKISGGQLEKADNSSSSGESKHITDLDTLNMTHSMMRSHRPFKTSTAVIFVTAYILTALCLPGK